MYFFAFLRSSFYRDLTLSVVFYCLVTVIITWPVVAQLTTGVAGDPNRDNLQFVWNLWWVQEAVVNQQVNPADVTMLHWPDGGTNQLLSLSVLIPLLALPTTLLGGPVFSYNLWFLLSFPLVGLSGWLLTYYVSGDRRAAFIGGLIFGFFPHKSFHAMGHYLQIMLFLFPLYAIALLRLLRRPSFRQALVTSLILSLCLLVNLVHIGFFLLPMSILLLAHHLWQVAFGRPPLTRVSEHPPNSAARKRAVGGTVTRSNDFSRFGPERLKERNGQRSIICARFLKPGKTVLTPGKTGLRRGKTGLRRGITGLRRGITGLRRGSKLTLGITGQERGCFTMNLNKAVVF
ncbi:MAG: hypothetical protein ACPGWR_20245 [Ardenticatenaceae bacterium]